MLESRVQIAFVPHPRWRLPLHQAFEVIHSTNYVATWMLPNGPPNLIIIEAAVQHPRLRAGKARQTVFDLLNGGHYLPVFTLKLSGRTTEQPMIQDATRFPAHPQHIDGSIAV